MNYKDKDTCSSQAPDNVDIEQCPVYQRWLDEQAVKDRFHQMIEDELTDTEKVIYGNG